MKEANVQRFEDLIQIVMMASSRNDPLTPASLPDELGLARHRFGRDMPAIPVCVKPFDRLFVELGEQNMRDSTVDRFGCMFQQIREPNVKPAFPETNRRIQRGEAAEPDIERRDRSARTKLAILMLKDFGQGGGHFKLSLACERLRNQPLELGSFGVASSTGTIEDEAPVGWAI